MQEPSESPTVLFERIGSTAVISLNRPRVKNALNCAMATALGNAVHEADLDPEIRVIISTGSGGNFCGGADLHEVAADWQIISAERPDWGFGGITQQLTATPTIAAINGFALGGGLEIALACDLAVMDEDAYVTLPEVTRGIFAAGGGILRLQRLIPRRLAMEAVLTGNPITAAQALQWGLVNRLSPSGTSVNVALELAQDIARNPVEAVNQSKLLMHQSESFGSTWDSDYWSLNDAIATRVYSSPEASEGLQSFIEKRKPNWQR
ncbi:unannotated protein [freshwater metagenome]|uniref:Unannotated protein n=1 Tax=freshwater metagenome TaxID=449393 RepID=A0A6J7R1U8_9ZZZZ